MKEAIDNLRSFLNPRSQGSSAGWDWKISHGQVHGLAWHRALNISEDDLGTRKRTQRSARPAGECSWAWGFRGDELNDLADHRLQLSFHLLKLLGAFCFLRNGQRTLYTLQRIKGALSGFIESNDDKLQRARALLGTVH